MAVEQNLDSAVLAHDLRNLLQIAGSALFQIDRNLDGATRSRVRVFELAAAESLARAGLLSRALLGTMASGPPAPEEISPGSAILAIKSLIDLTAGPAVRVDLEIEDEAPRIMCRRTDLECAVLNLIANARDAMPDGGAIRVSVAAARPFTLIRVRDGGTGMDPETVAKAFQPFFTTKGPIGGSGLGLAMVARFADQVGGSAKIESGIGAGTTVILCLPGTAS